MDNLIFREKSADMAEQDVLEYVLGFVCRNPNIVADNLIETFGSLRGVLESTPDALRKAGCSPKTAELLSAILPIVRAYNKSGTTTRVENRRGLEDLCRSLLFGKRVEEFWIICVNSQCRVIGKRRISTGSLTECSAYPRLIVETALNYNARSVFLSHNHPGGTCAPSREDISSTYMIKNALKLIDVEVLDHMIVAGENCYSMAQHGDI